MFSLKHQVRRHAMMIAAVAATVGFAAASHAAPIYWAPPPASDPDVGGDGSINDNYFLSGTDYVGGAGGDIVFGGTGGTVTVDVPISLHSLTLNGRYTISDGTVDGTGTITLPSGYPSYPTVLTSSGVNEIQAPISIPPASNNSQSRAILNVIDGVLTIQDIDKGGAGALIKDGDGVLRIEGKFGSGGGLIIKNGTVVLAGTASKVFSTGGTGGTYFDAITVDAPATLAGAPSLTSSGSITLQISGHFAPGDNNDASRFNSVGTFQINASSNSSQSATVTFNSGSQFDLDLFVPDFDLTDAATVGSLPSHDALRLYNLYNSNSTTASNALYLNIDAGAIININDGSDVLEEGIYRIITLDLSGTNKRPRTISYTGGDIADFIDTFASDLFTIGDASDLYSYDFRINTDGTSLDGSIAYTSIDLRITKKPSVPSMPEPASLGLMGLGCGVLLLRGKRRS
ncbi:MAG: PEP-CTERM sorting domain-containing protein [Phycisphaerales bacterium]|nr:PEP-CTERM sorting domain-containing protein [Phycisphaerales bacterium]